MSTKNDYSKKILKIISEKPAISIENIENKYPATSIYSLNRSLKNIIKIGYAEILNSGNKDYLKITNKGKNKLNSAKLTGEETLVDKNWDGFWRIIIFDIPESQKTVRDSLRYFLKKAGFYCFKNSIWINPYPFEYFFNDLKEIFKLKNEVSLFVTKEIDKETEKELRTVFCKTINFEK